MFYVYHVVAGHLLVVTIVARFICFGFHWFSTSGDTDPRMNRLTFVLVWPYTPYVIALIGTGLVQAMEMSQSPRLVLVLVLLTSKQSFLMALVTSQYYLRWQEQIPCNGILLIIGILMVQFLLTVLGVPRYYMPTMCTVTFLVLLIGDFLGRISVVAAFEIKMSLCLATLSILECNLFNQSTKNPCQALAAVYTSFTGRVVSLLSFVPVDDNSYHGHSNTYGPVVDSTASSAHIYRSATSEPPTTLDLHRHISPERWCITRKDLIEFVAGVRQAWLDGGIPEHPELPNPHHNDPLIGPNMYQVNQHFIRPMTLARGGASYALMLHPQGTPPCDVFMTHAWSEGVFEFAAKMFQNWPANCTYLWICFLAIPQNADIADMLGDNVLQSPFAKALEHAKTMIVIPNCFVSIYTRLWCVLEAKIAMEHGIDIRIPTAATPARLRAATFRSCILLAAAAVLAIFALECASQGYVGTASVSLLVIGRSATILTLKLLRQGLEQYNIVLEEARVILLGFACGLALHILLNDATCDSAKVRSRRTAAWTISCLIPLAVHWAVHRLRANILSREAMELTFTSVRNANCCDPADHARIHAAISGQEDRIDEMINILRDVGEMNARVRSELAWGIDPTSGMKFYWSKLIVSCVLWGVGFVGNSGKVCGPHNVSGPPTLLGYWEFKVGDWLSSRGWPCPPELWAVCLCGMVICTATASYSVCIPPHNYSAGYFVDSMWYSALSFVVAYVTFDTIYFPTPSGWSEKASRHLAHMKVYSYISALLVGLCHAIISPFVSTAHRRHILTQWKFGTAGIFSVFSVLALLCTSIRFETCCARCASEVRYDYCLSHCSTPMSLMGCFCLAICSASVSLFLMWRFHGRNDDACDQNHGNVRVELMEIGHKPAKALASDAPLQLPHEGHARRLDSTNLRIVYCPWLSSFVRSLCLVVVISFCSHTLTQQGDTVPYNQAFIGFGPALATSSASNFVLMACSRTSACLVAFETHRVVKVFPESNAAMHLHVRAVAFSHDSEKVVIALGDVARLWNARTSERLWEYVGHTDEIRSVAFSVDATMILTGSVDTTAILWDTETGAMLQTFKGHSECVNSVALALAKDNIQILTGSLDGTVKLWDMSGRAVRTFDNNKIGGHADDSVNSVAISADGSKILFGSTDNYARLVDSRTGMLIHGYKRGTKSMWSPMFGVRSVALSDDGAKLLTGYYDGRALLWDALKGYFIRAFNRSEAALPPAVDFVAFCKEDSMVLTGHTGVYDEVWLWNAGTAEMLGRLGSEELVVHSMAVNADATKVLIGGLNRPHTAALVDGQTGQWLQTFGGHRKPVSLVGLSADGTTAFTGAGEEKLEFAVINEVHHLTDSLALRVWDVRTGRLVLQMRDFGGVVVQSAALSLDGKKILTGSAAGAIEVWDASSGMLLRRMVSQGYIGAVSFGVQDRRVLSFTSGKDLVHRKYDKNNTGGHIVMWSTTSGKLLSNISTSFDTVRSLVLSADSTMIGAGGWRRDSAIAPSAVLWDTQTGTLVQAFHLGRKSFASCMAISKDNSIVVIGSSEGKTRWFAARSGKSLWTYYSHSANAMRDSKHVFLSADAERVVSSAELGFRLWKRRSGEMLQYHGPNQLDWLSSRPLSHADVWSPSLLSFVMALATLSSY